MKKLLSFSCFLLCISAAQTKAQNAFPTIDSIDINNIHASVLVHGDMWWDPNAYADYGGDYGSSIDAMARCNMGGARNINFAAAIWMSGYDAGNNLHVAAQTYRQGDNDYWPGPLDNNDTLTYASSQQWAKIWKVNGTDVQLYNSIAVHTTTNTPASILTWPAKGNAYAQGNAGAPLTIATDMAPFVDQNGNGIYEPLQGDYPDFRGDQALWWIFSDNGPTHTVSNARPLNVEVHAMAYAYKRGTLLDNVIYYDYAIVNRSTNNYHNFRFAQWDDVDLGYYLDDYIGFDSTWRLGICYNATDDDGLSGGHPINSFGPNPPQTGLTFVSLPGDAGTNYIPAGAFTTYNNDFSIIGYPNNDTQINNYMRAIYPPDHWTTAGTNFDQGPGPHIDSYYVTYPRTNYIFPGDPSDTSQLSECAAHYTTGDGRFILSSNDFSLASGGTQHVVIAQVVTDSAGSGGCPHASFAGIKRVADTAWNNYYNPPAPFHRNAAPDSSGGISAYPNPTHDKLYIEDKTRSMDAATITVYNFMGQAINVPVNKNGQRAELNISMLAPGLYYASYKNGNVWTNPKFIKE